MTTFLEVVEALIASREHCAGSLGRFTAPLNDLFQRSYHPRGRQQEVHFDS